MPNTTRVAKQIISKKEKSAKVSSFEVMEGLKEGLEDLRAGRTQPLEQMLDDLLEDDEAN